MKGIITYKDGTERAGWLKYKSVNKIKNGKGFDISLRTDVKKFYRAFTRFDDVSEFLQKSPTLLEKVLRGETVYFEPIL